MNVTRYIYLILVKSLDRWIPMYQPCYSLEEVRAKRKIKSKYFETKIARYEFEGTYE